MSAAREALIRNYITGYNTFALDLMTAGMAEDIVFENITNGVVNLSLKGKAAFLRQAELAASYFSERKQTIQLIQHYEDRTEIAIEYHAVLAMDMPYGLKKGMEINLSGKSVFVFEGGKIVRLTDISNQ